MTYDAILAEAMKLPPHERDRLALRLSMAEPNAFAEATSLSSAHEAALQRRIAAYEADPENVVPADESLRRARQHLEEHRERRLRDSKSA